MPFLPLIFLLLVACSNDLLHSETKSLSIEYISVEVQNKSYKVLTDYSVPYTDTILKKDVVFFYAKRNPIDARITSCNWFIKSEEYPCGQTEIAPQVYSFDSIGFYPVKLLLLDIFGDTLSANIFMRVSSEPICNNLSLDIFQGSPIFKWNCQNTDHLAELTYRFILKTRSKTETFLLKEDSLQLGYSLPNDYWEAHLSAENSYGLKAKLDTIFEAEEHLP